LVTRFQVQQVSRYQAGDAFWEKTGKLSRIAPIGAMDAPVCWPFFSVSDMAISGHVIGTVLIQGLALAASSK
jgi:hypothetical protein